MEFLRILLTLFIVEIFVLKIPIVMGSTSTVAHGENSVENYGPNMA